MCLGDDGEILPKEFCISQLGRMPEVAMACHVTCDVTTCQFSEWMDWSSCSERCGGVRTRTRVMEGAYGVSFLGRLGSVIIRTCPETVSRVGRALDIIKRLLMGTPYYCSI